ncbi:MAG TPA: cation-translocating P-type ATPase, partial [Anaerolineaceae bacterium]
GDPTEGALIVVAAQTGLMKDQLEQSLPRVDEVPFDSDRKRMTTVHAMRLADLPEPLRAALAKYPGAVDGARIAFTKGAVDGLLEVSNQVWDRDVAEALSPEWRKRILEANEGMASNGMRVLGTAFRILPDGTPVDPTVETDLTFVGLFGMIDPARPEVRDAVHVSQQAGIRPVMITGDHPLTALSIARELDIAKDATVLTGKDLENMSVEQLQEQVEHVQVFARVSPEHKLKIVEALQNLGHNVAMTGDGVNDAPALKRADIGVAMGITGTDVSKEAADMVLLDDNFATIVAAVEEGRRIYDNIRKFIRYALASNSGEVMVMLAAPFLGMPLPLTPLQILWVNLVTDGLPGLALTLETAEPSTMRRKPHSPNENIFARGLGRDVIWIGAVLALLSLLAGFIYWRAGAEGWQTMVFTTLTLAQMGNVMALRTDHESVFRVGLFSNKYMTGAVLLTILLQLAVIYLPFLQNIFSTTPLTVAQLSVSFGLGMVLFFAVELVKWLRRRSEARGG